MGIFNFYIFWLWRNFIGGFISLKIFAWCRIVQWSFRFTIFFHFLWSLPFHSSILKPNFDLKISIFFQIFNFGNLTWVSVRHSKVATSNRFGLERYLFILNWRSNSSSCCDVKAVRGRRLFDDPTPATKPKIQFIESSELFWTRRVRQSWVEPKALVKFSISQVLIPFRPISIHLKAYGYC